MLFCWVTFQRQKICTKKEGFSSVNWVWYLQWEASLFICTIPCSSLSPLAPPLWLHFEKYKAYKAWKDNLSFPVWTEWSLHILNNNNNKQHLVFCLSLGLLSNVQAWFLCCQRVTIPMCVMELPWLWVSAVRALETRWGPEDTRCQDSFCFLLPQRHLCANVTQRDQISRTCTLLASWTRAVL